MARIVSDPAVLAGKPVVAGTRISVELVLEQLAAGLSIAEIVEQYPHLKRADVLACLEFVKKNYAAPTLQPLTKN